MSRQIEPDDAVPVWMWRAAVGLLLAVVVGGAVLTALLAAGVAEPQPIGEVIWQISVGEGCLDIDELELPTLAVPGSIELTVDSDAAESPLAVWGLWLGDPESVDRWEVLAPGYYRHEGLTFSFHHVRAGSNTLRLDIRDGRTTLWLNKERALDGALARPVERWGLVDEGVCWRKLTLYSPD